MRSLDRIVVYIAAASACLVGCGVRPHGAANWDPPASNLPKRYLSVARVLFDHLIDDPQNGDFRRVTLSSASSWIGGDGEFQTTGWVLPGKPSRVVCWNGQSYNAVRVGEAVDLAGFMRQPHVVAFSGRPYGVVMDLGPSSDPDSLIGAALLLAVREPALAEEVYEKVTRYSPQVAAKVIGDATAFLYDKAVQEHIEGDDAQAAADARRLIDAWPALRAFLGVEPGAPSRVRPRVAEALLADSKRRLGHPRKLPVDPKSPTPERVAALIDMLDEVRKCYGTSGNEPIDVSADPVAGELEGVGERAIDALLACAETDDRLTRVARNFEVLPVRTAALDVVAHILHTQVFGMDPPVHWTAPAVRAYWNRIRKVPLSARPYTILDDDAASRNEWIQAAREIVHPDREREIYIWRNRWKGLPTKLKGAMAGESLRHGRNPTVTELMTNRALEMMDQDVNRGPKVNPYLAGDGVGMAVILGSWDPRGGLRGQAAVQKRGWALLAAVEARGKKTDGLARELAHLALQRSHHGDMAAASDYARLVRHAGLRGRGSAPAPMTDNRARRTAPTGLSPTRP